MFVLFICPFVLRSSIKAHINFLKAEADDNEVLLSTRDFSGNTFEVKKNGRHAFYSSDTYDARKCQQCILVKDEYESEHFGERCVVVNRDNSGGCHGIYLFAVHFKRFHQVMKSSQQR